MKKIYALCLLLLAVGCKKDDSESLPLNAEKDILSFVFTLEDKPYTALIKGTDITVSLPEDTPVEALSPTITISKGATLSPNTGVAQDFTKPVNYTVTAQDKTTGTYSYRTYSSRICQRQARGRGSFFQYQYLTCEKGANQGTIGQPKRFFYLL